MRFARSNLALSALVGQCCVTFPATLSTSSRAFVSWAPVKLARVKLAPRKSAKLRSALRRSHRLRLAMTKVQLASLASVKVA